MRQAVCAIGIGLVGLVAVLSAVPSALAQVTTFAPSATISAGLDDNVLWAPLGAPDTVLRLTPGFAVRRESDRTTWYGTYSFDAERYDQHPELTTALARQTGHGEGRIALSASTTFAISGGYDSSLSPADLNLTTGLADARIRVWREAIQPELIHNFGPATLLDVTYQLSGDFVSGGDTITTHSVDILFQHDLSGRHAWFIKAIGRDYRFTEVAAPTGLLSLGALVGWKERFTPLTTLSVAAGPRQDAGSIQPEIQASLDRKTGIVQVSASYDQTSSTAVGVPGLIRVERGLATAETHLPADLDATLQVGGFWNTFQGTHASVFRAGAEIAKHFKNAVTLAVSYASDVQRGLIGLPGIVVVPEPGLDFPSEITGASLGQTVIRRNVVLFRMTIAPDMRPHKTPPTKPGGQTP